MSTELTFKQSLNHIDYGATALDLRDRQQLAESILTSERPFGYSNLLSSDAEKITELFEKEKPDAIKGIVGATKTSTFGRIVSHQKEVKRHMDQQLAINKAVQNVLHTQYQTRDVRSPLSHLEVGLFYLIDAFDSYLTSDLKIIKETYTAEAQDFANKINQYYMHFDLNTKSSLVGRQIKACIDNSMQLHKLLKK